MFAQTCRSNLVAIASAYAKAAKTSMGQTSKRFYGNRTFLRDFKAGKLSVSVDKFDEMIGAFAEKWPPGAPWPWTRAIMIPRPRRRRGAGKKTIPNGK